MKTDTNHRSRGLHNKAVSKAPLLSNGKTSRTPSVRRKKVAATAMSAMPTPETAMTVLANVDVGFGNALYIRGQGVGLNWEQGARMECLGGSTWTWAAEGARESATFKLLLNDQLWAQGEDLTVRPGERLEVVPTF